MKTVETFNWKKENQQRVHSTKTHCRQNTRQGFRRKPAETVDLFLFGSLTRNKPYTNACSPVCMYLRVNYNAFSCLFDVDAKSTNQRSIQSSIACVHQIIKTVWWIRFGFIFHLTDVSQSNDAKRKHTIFPIDKWNPTVLMSAVVKLRRTKEKSQAVHVDGIKENFAWFVCVQLNESTPKSNMHKWHDK